MFKKNMSKCKLFSTQVFDQLKDHYVYFDSEGSIKCRFDYKNFVGSTVSSNSGSGISNMLNFINDNVDTEVWTPVIAQATLNSTMPYFEGKLNKSSIIGFENFLSFDNPKFKDISFTGNIKIGLDWILNDPINTEIDPISGVLFWYKKNRNNFSIDINTFGVGDWFYNESNLLDKSNNRTILAGTLFVKISSEYVQILPLNVIQNRVAGLSIPLSVLPANQQEPEVVLINNLVGKQEWKLYHSVFSIKKNSNFYSIHIPDGDYFEFNYISNRQRSNYLTRNLVKTYNSIYNALIDNGRYDNNNSIAKHLACVLATGPQLDKITFSNKNLPFLPTIENTVEYCQEIYRRNRVLYNERIYNTSLTANIIRPTDSNFIETYSKTLNDIYLKLVDKYGLYIKFEGTGARLNIHKDMVWDKQNSEGGPNISVNSEFFYWMDRNRDIVKESALPDSETDGPGHNYYDQTIQAGPMRMKSTIRNQNFTYESIDSPDASAIAKLIKPSKNPFFNSEDNFYIMVPEIRYAMFYKQGGMKIAVSNCFINERLGSASAANGKLDDKTIFLKEGGLGSAWNPSGDEATRGLTAKRYGYNRSLPFHLRQPSIGFDLYDNIGCIKLYHININFLRYNHENLCNCESFYQETILRSKSALIANNTAVPFLGDIVGDSPPTIGFRRINFCDRWNLGGNEYEVPSVSTKYAPPIKSYGGYDPEIIANIGVVLPDHPSPGTYMPILSERNPNYDFNLKCYARSGYLKDESLVPGGYSQNHVMGSIVFTKGFFHPHFGWINYNSPEFYKYRGSTAVWSHKSDKKSRFVFKGVGFLFDDDSFISEKRKAYSSTIQIIEAGGSSDPNSKSSYSSWMDELSYDGMRSVNLNPNFLSNEYIVFSCIPNKVPADAPPLEKLSDRPCTDSGWPSSALPYSPYVKYKLYKLIDENLTTIHGSNLNNLRIKDISVKLNFLNFDSTKDMKIYLKAQFSRGGQTPPFTEQIVVFNVPPEIDGGDSLNDYIRSLVNEHPNDTIVLLNKEFIQNYDKDFVISFSDYADANVFLNSNDNTANDPEFSNIGSRVATYNDIVPASYRPSNYTETDAKKMREKLNNYGVTIINNKFRKWYGNYLLDSQFVLHIDIDNNYNTTSYSNIVGLEHKEPTATSDMYKSNVISNSLCNWQLIIDTYSDSDSNIQKRVPCNINHPTTEHIDYTKPFYTNETNAYDSSKGYNFIGDFKDKKFLIPPVNHNAPLNSLKTFNECVYPKNEYNGFGFYKTSDASQRWLTQAILFATASTSVGLITMGGGLGGAMVGLSLFGAAIAAAVASIVNWFNHQRQAALVDAFDNTYYDASYDRYGYGFPDRALVEISTNNGYSWYSFDAKIFKYNQTCSPIYKPALYGYNGGGIISSENNSESTVSDHKAFLAGSPDALKLSPETYINNDSFVLKATKVNPNEDLRKSNIITINSSGNEQIVSRHNNVVGSSSLLYNLSGFGMTANILFDSIKPFYILRTNFFGLSNYDIDLMINNLNDVNNKYRSVIFNITPVKIGIIPYNGKFQTLLSLPINRNFDSCIVKPSNASSRLDLRLEEIVSTGCEYSTTLNLLNFNRSLIKDNKVADYFISTFSEGGWGSGSGSDVLHNVSHLIIPEDRTLLNYTLPFYGNRYLGSLILNGSVISEHATYIGAFNDINSLGIQNNILDKTLNYQNTIFYLFGGISATINNSIAGNKGRIVFYNLLHRSDPKDNLVYLDKYNNVPCVDDRSCNEIYECYDNNKYWISIDKDQYGVYTPLTGIKVLDSIRYGCSQPNFAAQGGSQANKLECPNVCGDEGLEDRDIQPPPDKNKERIGVKTFRVLFNAIASVERPTIEFTNANVDIQKAEVEKLIGQPIEWEKMWVDRRDLQVSCQSNSSDTIIRIREYYWVPKFVNTTIGEQYIKAETLLEASNNIRVRFKNITRKLRNMDMRYEKYIVDFRGNTVRGGITSTDGMNLKNNFISWICNLTDLQTERIVQTLVPNYYKMLNEMIFRGFFGSADGAEMKLPTSKAVNAFEWIPYEYDRNAPGCRRTLGDRRLNPVARFIAGLSNAGLKLRCYLLIKLVSTPAEKRRILQNCIKYMNGRTDGGIVPNKKEFDLIYATKDSPSSASKIQQLINEFLK